MSDEPAPSVPPQLLKATGALQLLMREYSPNILFDAFVAAVPDEIMAQYLAAQPLTLLTKALDCLPGEKVDEVVRGLGGAETRDVTDILAKNADLANLLLQLGKLNNPTTVALVALANLPGDARNRAIASLGRAELLNAVTWLEPEDQAWLCDGLEGARTPEQALRYMLDRPAAEVAAAVEPSSKLSLAKALLRPLALQEQAEIIATASPGAIRSLVSQMAPGEREHVLRGVAGRGAKPEEPYLRYSLVDENGVEFARTGQLPGGNIVRHINVSGHPTRYRYDKDAEWVTEVGPGGRDVVLIPFRKLED